VRRVGSLLTLAAALVIFAPSATASDEVLSLRGFGTAVVDGVLTPSEWDAAGRFDFQANRSPAEGGGTVPASLYVMNDPANLYLALRISVTSLGNSAFDSIFVPPGPNPANGGDVLRALPWTFEDLHFHPVAPSMWEWLADTADGGTQDGAAAAQTNGGVSVFEVAHPLNSADDTHDFGLTIPSHISFVGSIQHCIAGSCAGTFMPGSDGGRVVVVSGTHVPPETTITDGPQDGAELPDYGLYVFSGADDVAPRTEITFECKVDAQEWSSCASPFAPVTIEDGWHTLSIRALDDMLNADPTPAQRRWRTDSKSPSKPRVARFLRGNSALTQFRFSSSDAGTPARRLRFQCAVDAKRLHVCGSRHRVRLPSGRHVLRVRTADPAGNKSDVRIVRFAVRRPAA
jgi:hypothetical protein